MSKLKFYSTEQNNIFIRVFQVTKSKLHMGDNVIIHEKNVRRRLYELIRCLGSVTH